MSNNHLYSYVHSAYQNSTTKKKSSAVFHHARNTHTHTHTHGHKQTHTEKTEKTQKIKTHKSTQQIIKKVKCCRANRSNLISYQIKVVNLLLIHHSTAFSVSIGTSCICTCSPVIFLIGQNDKNDVTTSDRQATYPKCLSH